MKYKKVNKMQNINKNWKLSGDRLNKELDCFLPMDVFSVLEENKIIPNPYHAQNEYDVRWVGEQEWQLFCQFTPKAEILTRSFQWLSLTGLDTRADIFLNNQEVAQACNMHDKHIIDVTGKLKDNNHLNILLKNNVEEAEQRAKKLPFSIPHSGGDNNQVPHMNLLRKPQCHAGWDWGLMLLTSGIYGDVLLEGDNHARLCAVTSHQEHKEGRVTVTFSVHLDVYHGGERELQYSFDDRNYRHKIQLVKGQQIIELPEIIMDAPKLWWPHDYGEPFLYDFHLSFDLQHIHQKIGLRTMAVISKPDDHGKSFIIKVNNQPIFCKGANWIPMDAKPQEHKLIHYERLIKDAKVANMNMLRIWGGGQYEKEEFYEICDREGILLWHDLMFACALYPSEDWFLKEVEAELDYQITRLQHHASIALWCGDNEVIGAINWFEIARNNRDTYVANYDRLNRFCGQKVRSLDKTRIFWPSSPSAGELDFSDTFHDPSSGDMHYWAVWHEGKSLDTYKDIQPRFCSEFGFQSFPSLPEVKKFCSKEHYNLTSPTMESHQKNNRGNSIIIEMFSRYFRMPKNFAYQLWLSQVQQALAIQMAVNYWRASQPICMGTLYWQLNDNWPVSSWSSIQHSGRWRLLHYMAKRFYAPILMNIVTSDKDIKVNAICDDINGGNIQGKLTLYDFDGRIIKEWRLKKSFTNMEAKELLQLNIQDFYAYRFSGFFALEYENNEGYQLECAFLAKPKEVELPKVHIEYEIKGNNIELYADKAAFFVSLECEDTPLPLSDNCIFLLPNQKRIIQLPEGYNKEMFSIYHLGDSF